MEQSSDETRRRPRRKRSRRKSQGEPQQPQTPASPSAAPPDARPPQESKQQQPSRSRSRGKRKSGGSPQQTGGPSLGGPRGKLRVIPMGGVGEVGKNATVVEFEDDLVLLDAGGKFPEEDQHAIDLIVPDVSYVRDRLPNLRAILITHGHEDHIGGL